jgi:hypothetical protein
MLAGAAAISVPSKLLKQIETQHANACRPAGQYISFRLRAQQDRSSNCMHARGRRHHVLQRLHPAGPVPPCVGSRAVARAFHGRCPAGARHRRNLLFISHRCMCTPQVPYHHDTYDDDMRPYCVPHNNSTSIATYITFISSSFHLHACVHPWPLVSGLVAAS